MAKKTFTTEQITSTQQEAKILIEKWRREFNQIRPHSSLSYRSPAPEAVLMPAFAATPYPGLAQALT